MGSVLGTLSTLDVVLVTLVAFFVCYRLWNRKRQEKALEERRRKILPPMKKQDLTVEQLKEFDGSNDGRILLAVNGKVFDVSVSRHMYGKDGPYGIFAGHDASRGLALMQLDESVIRDTYDDLADLSSVDLDTMREWGQQLQEKYPLVGRLLKPGEEPDVYSDSEDETSTSSSATSASQKKLSNSRQPARPAASNETAKKDA